MICLVLNDSTANENARVVELVDSLASGASARKGVRVRLPPRAPVKSTNFDKKFVDFTFLRTYGPVHFFVNT